MDRSDYAVSLYFDEELQSYLQGLISSIAAGGVNAYMLDEKIPPHVTLSYFQAGEIAPVASAIEAKLPCIERGRISFASLGAFAPKVLFASPVPSAYLLGLNRMLNELLAPFVEFGGGGYYLPDRWTPHAALALKMTGEEANRAFCAAALLFEPKNGFADRLALARCNPYRELKVWNLRSRIEK